LALLLVVVALGTERVELFLTRRKSCLPQMLLQQEARRRQHCLAGNL
jgi:hypothetical protein